MLQSNIPMIDLHLHLRGTISPGIAARLAARNRCKIADGIVGRDGKFAWNGFPQFLEIYAKVGQLVRCADDLRFLAEEWLVLAAEEGTIYVELMLSPLHVQRAGIGVREQISAVSAGIEAARSRCGIEAKIVATAVRHHGPAEAEALAEYLSEAKPAEVTGFGLTGDEHKYAAADFRRAFQIAANSGLGLTAHTGEWRGPRDMMNTVETLGLARVGHGIRAVEDEGVLRELKGRGVGWEVCISSNLALRLGSRAKTHPITGLIASGCSVALGTDDPGFFDTTLGREYLLANTRFGVSEDRILKITRDAVNMAFCSGRTKAKLLRLVPPFDS